MERELLTALESAVMIIEMHAVHAAGCPIWRTYSLQERHCTCNLARVPGLRETIAKARGRNDERPATEAVSRPTETIGVEENTDSVAQADAADKRESDK